MNSVKVLRRCTLVLAFAAVCIVLAASTNAQVQSTTAATAGTPTRQVTIESGEVVDVAGNDLFVKMADGTLRHFPNVPESAKVIVGGQQLGVHDLKPGMKLVRETVTITTPLLVTTVQSVTGKVWHVTPPLSVVLTLDNGQNEDFNIPQGQKFVVDNKEVDAWGLREGMIVTATKIVEEPETIITREKLIAATMPANVPVLIAKAH